MKVGDLVRPAGSADWLGELELGVIIETHVKAATRRADRGRNVNCHHVYWSDPISKAVWVMERELLKVLS